MTYKDKESYESSPPCSGIYPDKLPDSGTDFFSPSFGPTLMARGSVGAVRLAAACPR